MTDRFVFATLVNNRAVLERCLLRSPAIVEGAELIVLEGQQSAAAAYNAVLDSHTGVTLICVHQDMYLPENWLSNVKASIETLEQMDPNWGVLGLFGVDSAGVFRGQVYCTNAQGVLGSDFATPQQVRVLDEIVLILRSTSSLRFDPKLPGFHLYGSDICLEAERLGRRNYVIPAFAVHNASAIISLPLAFWRSYLRMRHLRSAELPIKTPCVTISATNIRALATFVLGHVRAKILRSARGRRVDDPVALYQQLREQR